MRTRRPQCEPRAFGCAYTWSSTSHSASCVRFTGTFWASADKMHEQRHDEVKRCERSSHHRSDRHSPHPHSTLHVRGLFCTWLPFGTRLTRSRRSNSWRTRPRISLCAEAVDTSVPLCTPLSPAGRACRDVRECAGAVQDARRRLLSPRTNVALAPHTTRRQASQRK